LKIFIGSVRTTSAELEEFFATEELEDFEDFLDELEELFDFFELEERFDFPELDDSSTAAELDDRASFLLEDETLALLEELLPFSKLELVSTTSSELEEVSGSTLIALEESSPQATKKSKEKMGNKLRIFIFQI
jgi:dsDNA-specific endonuclease/ATPase MutS2